MTINQELLLKRREYRELELQIENRVMTSNDRLKFEVLFLDILTLEEQLKNTNRLSDITNNYRIRNNKLKFGIDEVLCLENDKEVLLIRRERKINLDNSIIIQGKKYFI